MKMEEVQENPIPKTESPKEVSQTKQNWWEIKDLPSRGRFYDKDTKILGRSLTVLEIKKLAMIDEENGNEVIDSILKQAVKGIDVDSLLVSDKIYIMFWLRYNTYKDSRYKVAFTCPKCGKPSEYHFSLDMMNITYLKDDYKLEPITLPESGDKITIGYQRVRDIPKIAKLETKVKQNPLAVWDAEIGQIAGLIWNIESKNNVGKDMFAIYEYLIGLSPADYVVIEQFIEESAIGVVPSLNIPCGSCQEVVLIGLQFQSEFFIPKYRVE